MGNNKSGITKREIQSGQYNPKNIFQEIQFGKYISRKIKSEDTHRKIKIWNYKSEHTNRKHIIRKIQIEIIQIGKYKS